jgi:putative ABC transport system permease protein
MSEFWRKLKAWRRRDALDAELQEEIQTHLEMRAEDTGSAYAARRAFGSAALIFEDSRSAWGWPGAEGWLRDLRYGLRVMTRRPGFAATVVATLTLGIGATVTVFSVVDTVMIRSLPYHAPERLVAVNEVLGAGVRVSGVAPGRLEDWDRLGSSLEGIAGSYLDTLIETSGAAPERMSTACVSPRFFAVLGVSPVAGRVFNREEERFGGPAAVVISHKLWRRRFGGEAGVVGRSLLLSGKSYTIVGVMPPSLQYPAASAELWMPKQVSPELMQIRAARMYRFTVGRLRPRVSLDQARTELGAVQARLAEQYPTTDAGWTVLMDPLKENQVGKVKLALWLLFGSAAVLLVIACTNVACLLLSQFSARADEVALRRALGASHGAIARQLLAEGLAYAWAGGLGGVLLAFAAVDAVRKIMPELPRIQDLTIDIRVLAFAAAIAVAVATLVSLAPILKTVRRNERLALGGRGLIGRGQWLPQSLVSAQIALTTVLLVGSGLFLRSLIKLQQTELGFKADHVLSFRITATFNEDAPAVVERHRRTLDALSSLPGAESVAMARELPGTAAGTLYEFRIAGQENQSTNAGGRYAAQRSVTAGYFQTMGIRILNGRTCRMGTDPNRPFEALVNQALVDRLLEGRNPIGLNVTATNRPMPIVGITADSHESGYARTPEPLIYVCGYLRFTPDSEFLIQTRGPAETMARAVREAMQVIDPSRPVYAVSPLTDVLSGTLAQNRFRTWLMSAFSAIALILAGVGVYGVTAYMVSQRVREFGIRMALGAQPAQIWSEILALGGRLTAIGAVAGGVLALLSTRLVATLLFGVGAFDAIAYSYAGAVLFGAALLACLVPGRRATSIDPARALREQ